MVDDAANPDASACSSATPGCGPRATCRPTGWAGWTCPGAWRPRRPSSRLGGGHRAVHRGPAGHGRLLARPRRARGRPRRHRHARRARARRGAGSWCATPPTPPRSRPSTSPTPSSSSRRSRAPPSSPTSLLGHAWSQLPDPSRYAAITDPGTPLAALAAERGFARCFDEPARHRRAVLGAVVFRHGAGRAHRLRRRRALRARPRRRPGRGGRARHGHGRGRPGRAGQGDHRRAPARTRPSACGSSSSSPSPRASRAPAASRSPPPSPRTGPTATSCRCTSTSRPTSASSSTAGRWPPPCAATCSASTPSTSPTWPSRRRTPTTSWPSSPCPRWTRPTPTASWRGWLDGRPGDYVSIQAYLPFGQDAALEALRRQVRDHLGGVAVTAGYGPRFLHSTGQLHKGGPDTVVAVQIVDANPMPVVPVPERPTTSAPSSRPRPSATTAASSPTAGGCCGWRSTAT